MTLASIELANAWMTAITICLRRIDAGFPGNRTGGERVDEMPKEKSGYFDNKEYQNEYHKNMKNKLISFNPANAEDMVLWEYMMSKGYGNVTTYIKSLIKKDMELQDQEKDDEPSDE